MAAGSLRTPSSASGGVAELDPCFSTGESVLTAVAAPLARSYGQPMTDISAGLEPLEGSYLTPSLEHARVSDAMRPGVIACPPDSSMETVARIMATNHVHAVVLSGVAGGEPWAVVTDRDLLSVAEDAPERLAGSCATTDPLMIEPTQSLREAVRIMREHELSHLLVVDPGTGRPAGVLSTLDVAGIVGWGRG